MNKLALILLLGSVSQAVCAGVYKWVDDSGQVHYGERPPATATQAKPMRLKPSPPPPAESQEQDLAKAREQKQKKEREQKEQARREAEKAREKANEEVSKHNCKVARANLNVLTVGGRVFSMDEKGNRNYVGDAQRDSEIQKTREEVDKWCR